MVDEFAVSLLRESTLVALALPCSSQCSLLHATALLEAHASLGAILVMQARGGGGHARGQVLHMSGVFRLESHGRSIIIGTA